MGHKRDSWPEVNSSYVVNSYLKLSLWQQHCEETLQWIAARSAAQRGHVSGTCVYVPTVAICPRVWRHVCLTFFPQRSSIKVGRSVLEKWRIRWLSPLKKDWNLQDKTKEALLFGMKKKKNNKKRKSSIRFWSWDIGTIFFIEKQC